MTFVIWCVIALLIAIYGIFKGFTFWFYLIFALLSPIAALGTMRIMHKNEKRKNFLNDAQ